MATNKKKKGLKMRDLKASKDAKGGAARRADSTLSVAHRPTANPGIIIKR